MSKLYSRRKFLSLTGLTATGALLAACGASSTRERVSSTATSVPTEAPLASPTAAAAAVALGELQVLFPPGPGGHLFSDAWHGLLLVSDIRQKPFQAFYFSGMGKVR